MEKTSQISGFYKKSPAERLEHVKEFGGLDDEEAKIIGNTGALDMGLVDRMIENVVGTIPVPLGYATNFMINGEEKLVPMAIEEPSVVAAASNAAKLTLPGGGFKTSNSGPIMIGQIQLTGVKDPNSARLEILAKRDKIVEMANECDPILVKFGGGMKDMEVRVIDSIAGSMVVTHLVVDCRDAAGMNAVNTMAEAVAPYIEEITGGRVYLRIISNLAIYRLARSKAVWTKESLGGEEIVDGIIQAYAFADADPFRCSTHNKGIMNGIDAVVLATGNDFRAIEAGAHSYAAYTGRYKSLTTYEKNENGDLVGTIELPMAVGLIGGATAVHPTAKANVKVLGIKHAHELAEIIASVGLAQNFAAMRALATEGIQRGHMKLHARNIATMAGAKPEQVEAVVAELVKRGKVRMDIAQEIVNEMNKSG